MITDFGGKSGWLETGQGFCKIQVMGLSALFSSNWGRVGEVYRFFALLFARLLYTYCIWARSLRDKFNYEFISHSPKFFP